MSKKTVFSLLFFVSLIATAALATVTLLAHFETRWFIWNVIAQFRWQYVCGSLILAAFFAAFRRPIPALCAILVSSANLFEIGNLAGANFQAGKNAGKLRILQMNVNSRSTEYSRVIDYIRTIDPDLFIVEELTPQLNDRIVDAVPAYKFTRTEVRESPVGIGLYSKLPLKNVQLLDFSKTNRLAVSATVSNGAHSLTVVGIHLTSPVQEGSWQIQNLELDVMAEQCARLPRPLVLAGDFNCAPWLKEFKTMMHSLQLTDLRKGPGPQMTWPTHEPITRFPAVGYKRIYVPLFHLAAMLPLDHYLVSRDVEAIDEFVGPSIGSDHYPLVLDVSWSHKKNPGP